MYLTSSPPVEREPSPTCPRNATIALTKSFQALDVHHELRPALKMPVSKKSDSFCSTHPAVGLMSQTIIMEQVICNFLAHPFSRSRVIEVLLLRRNHLMEGI